MRMDGLSSSRSRGQPRMPTMSRLPPLTALRAFVVTARHGSFAGAADELHVSTAAIGQQVRILETHLGQTLFNRQRGDLVLTDAGAALYPGLADAFDSMIESISDLLRDGTRQTLELVVDSAFATRLLAPKLGRIRQGLGDVELSISTLEGGRFDPLRFDADCAVVAISEPLAGFVCEPLFDDAILAVCTPEFSERHGLADAPERLRDAAVETLRCGGDDTALEWATWLRACGIPVRPARTGLRLSQQTALIETTLSGHGISLLRQSLVIDDLERGRLVTPFGSPQPTSNRYHLLTSPKGRRQPEVAFLLALLRGHETAIDTAA